MKTYYYSFFCYLLALFLALIFASQYERNTKKNRLFFYLSFLTTALFCGLRFYVGNDYEGYFEIFHDIADSRTLDYKVCEPGFLFLNYLFKWSNIGYVYVLFISSFVTFYLVYKRLEELNIVKWGVFCFYTLCFLIIVNDQVRQGLAIAIFFYSTRYIEHGKFWRFLILVLVATLFHYTAIITIFAYPLRWIKINPFIAVIVICLCFGIKVSGVAEGIMDSLTLASGFLNEKYAAKIINERYFSGVTFGFQLLYFFIVSLFVALNGKRIKKEYYNIFVVGASLYMIFWGQMLFERLSLYYFQIIILVLPFVLKRKNIFAIGIIILCLGYYSAQSLFAMEKNGAVPYRTILFENLEHPKFTRESQE